MKNKWLSVHIYYGKPFEGLLIKGIKPLVEKLMVENHIKSYFFIRYWERGPHIRLRLQSAPNVLEELVKPYLLATIGRYMKENPSRRYKPEWELMLPANQRWCRNNSLQFEKYEPEVFRYGGKYAIALAEQHFSHSSDTVLAILSSGKGWDYNRALGAALELHLSLAHSIGLDMYQAQRFFNQIYTDWLPHATQIISETPKQKEKKTQQNRLIAFKITYERQKETLLPFIRSFWKLLEKRSLFARDWLNEWVRKVKDTDEQLRAIQREGQLITPYLIHPVNTMNQETMKEMVRWNLYNSFIHMTNNRLGIFNHDEGYLGYLLESVLKDISTM